MAEEDVQNSGTNFLAQLAAMFREAVKDVRQTLNESYYGQGEHMPEAGTPMNPTQQQVTAALEQPYEPMYEPSTAVVNHDNEIEH